MTDENIKKIPKRVLTSLLASVSAGVVPSIDVSSDVDGVGSIGVMLTLQAHIENAKVNKSSTGINLFISFPPLF